MNKILQLALPVALSHTLVMVMGLVDLAFVRHVGTTATGAVGVASALFGWTLTVGIGCLAGMDYFVSTSHGAKRPDQARTYLGQGVWLALVTGVPLSGVLYFAAHHLPALGINPLVVPETSSFLKILSVGLFPVFLFGACRNYLQAISRPFAPFVTLIIANLLNLLFNWTFIFGKLGMPAMGADGCAVATSLCRVFMASSLLLYVLGTGSEGRRSIPIRFLRFQSDAFRRLVAMGFPAAMQMIMEVGVFGLSTVLAGGLDAESLAAHQIVLNVASTTFMVPLGIGAAASVLVGQSLGRRDTAEAARMGWMGLVASVVFMAVTGVIMIAAPTGILGTFSVDPVVLSIARNLLVIAAIFQISDGMQTALTGALRGLGDTRTPVAANFIGHWVIGLPLSLFLCFRQGWGVSGIWVGLAVGLFIVAIWLLFVWAYRLKRAHFRIEHLPQ